MRIPFTADELLDTFRRYNEANWPLQWMLFLVGFFAIASAWRYPSRAARPVLGMLAFLWMWMGTAYHLAFFRAVNPAATVFAVFFVAQGLAFAWCALSERTPQLFVQTHEVDFTSLALSLFAIVGYPAVAYVLDRRYPGVATFGLPCPTTILTLGVLLRFDRSIPRVLFAIPLLWALVATTAALQLGIWEDLGLTLAGIATGVVLLSGRPGRFPAASTHLMHR